MLKLTSREEEIMQHFWRDGPMPVRRLVELFPEPRPHVNTVSTLVRILEEKGCVAHRPDGRGYVYYPMVSPSEVGRTTVRGAIARYFDNSFLGMVSALVKEEDVSVDELRGLLDEIERSRGETSNDKN